MSYGVSSLLSLLRHDHLVLSLVIGYKGRHKVAIPCHENKPPYPGTITSSSGNSMGDCLL